MNAAVFLDKDGTLVEDVPYNVDPARIRLAPGATNAIRLLARSGCPIAIVSNQSGVARGLFEETALLAVRDRLEQLLGALGAELAGFYYCPHHPDGCVPEFAVPCECRKPGPELLHRAAADLGVSLRESWMVGDILDDVEAGTRAGCHTVLVNNGNESEWRLGPGRFPEVIVQDLEGAARVIAARVAREAKAL